MKLGHLIWGSVVCSLMTYNFFPYFQEEAIMMNVCSCLEKNFFQLQSWAAYQLSGGRIVCLILGQQKPIGNYNTMGRSLEQKPIHHKVQERHYVWLSQFWSHFSRTNALFASKAKINIFLFFWVEGPQRKPGMKKNFKKRWF